MITGIIRFSYLNAFEPGETPSGEMRYSAAILISKDDEATLKEIELAINKAIEKGINTGKFNKAQATSLRLPLRDGDAEHEAGNRGPEYKGHFFINASNKNRPGVVNAQAKPIFDANDFYSGCYGRADINFFPYNTVGNRGIGVGLNNLMKIKDGERLDGKMKAEDAFASFAQMEAEGDLE